MKPTKHNVYAVVIDIDHINGLQTARILRARGIPVIGIANNPKHYCARTNVCSEIIQSSTKDYSLIKTLKEISDRFNEPPILIPSQDTSVILISRHRKELESLYHIALPVSETVEMLMDKPSFYAFAVKEGLPVAKYFLVKNYEEALAASNNLNYPCILKPPMRSPKWEENTKIKAFKAFNKDELLDLYNKCSGWHEVLMFQEWIEGTDTDLYSCNCYFSKSHEALVSFTAKKLRQYPPVTGNTSLGIECRADEVNNVTLELFKKVNYFGLGYLEMKRDVRTGKFYIIEPNIGRPTGRSALAEAAGVEILYTMYCDLLNLPLPEERTQKYLGIKWIQIRTDFLSAFYYWRKKELSLSQWINSLKGPKFYAVFSLEDPKPFIFEIIKGLQFIVAVIIKRIFKPGPQKPA